MNAGFSTSRASIVMARKRGEERDANAMQHPPFFLSKCHAMPLVAHSLVHIAKKRKEAFSLPAMSVNAVKTSSAQKTPRCNTHDMYPNSTFRRHKKMATF
jgi:hypothetical protein